MRRIVSIIISILLILSLSACETKNQTSNDKYNNAEGNLVNKSIILSTTTSTENSGLLDYILPEFEKDTGIKVKVVAVGTGQALEMGKSGDSDVLLVHAKDSEIKFVEEGFGEKRIEVMYNDFVLVGPKEDPAKIKEKFPQDIVKAMALIAATEEKFISRGDDSGTHKMELNLWKKLEMGPQGNWYVSAGQGMGKVLQMGSELKGYTLTDRATYLSMMDKLDLAVVVEGDILLFNQYGVIAVSKEKHPSINLEGANRFIEWITSTKVQQMIGEFGKDKYGQSLFIPNAVK